MAKQSGLGDNLYLDGYDFSGDIGSLKAISGGPKAWEVPGIDVLGQERIGLTRDGKIDFTAYFNPSVNRAHSRLSLLPTTDVHAMYARGTALGNAAACLISKQVNYDPSRGNDGSLTIDTSLLANAFGLEWGVQLTAGKRTDTVATNGTGVDLTTVSTSFGWQAYLQVFAFTGTSVTVTIQDSADNAAFANVTGAAFTAATGITKERLASASPTATVRRYLRAITSGTFSSATFAVMFVRNESVSVAF